MIYEKKQLIPVFCLTLLAGMGLHALYRLWPNAVTALFSPVRESLWEHIKILYWPYLAASAFLAWGRPTGMRPWLLSLVILCPLMLVLGLLLHAALALHALWLDIALYLGLMAFGFWFPVRFSGPFRGWRWRIPAILAFLLGALILLFTFFPPAGVLFADLS